MPRSSYHLYLGSTRRAAGQSRSVRQFGRAASKLERRAAKPRVALILERPQFLGAVSDGQTHNAGTAERVPQG